MKRSRLPVLEVVLFFVVAGGVAYGFKHVPIEEYTFQTICPVSDIPTRLSWVKGERIADVKKIENTENAKHSESSPDLYDMSGCKSQTHVSKLYIL